MTKERTPKTPRSVVRNHSPYCESTGPIVQEGFVAARVRALQGFSHQAQSPNRSRSPLTPRPRSFLELKPAVVISDTETIKRFPNPRVSNAPKHVVDTPEEPANFADVAPVFQRQEQHSSFESTEAIESRIRGKVEKISTPCCSLSEGGRVDDIPAGNSTPSEKSILSPHAIQADLIEPRTTWICLPQTEDRNNDYVTKQALKPRGSIADKLGFMVERGWEGDDTYSKIYNDNQFAQGATKSIFSIPNSRLDSRSDAFDEAPSLKEAPSRRRSLSVSIAELRSKLQSPTDIPSEGQKMPRMFMDRDLQAGKQRQEESSSAVKIQRSSSDAGVRYLKTESAAPREKRRAQTLHSLGYLTSRHSQPQPKASPHRTHSYAWEHRDNNQGLELTKLPLSRECSIPIPDFDLEKPKTEQLEQDFAAPSKSVSSCPSSPDTKESTRSNSRSTSFFKKFPWYKVALVNKESVDHSLSRGGWGIERVSRTSRAAHLDSTLDQIELSQGVSKSSTAIGCEHEEEDCPKVPPSHQGPDESQAINTTKSSYRASGLPNLQLMTSSEEMNKRHVLEQTQRMPQRPQDSYTRTSDIKNGCSSEYPHQVVKNAIGNAQGPTRRGLTGMPPSTSSQSGPIGASFESFRSGDFAGLQPYTPSYAKTAMLHADGRKEACSSDPETMEAAQRLLTSPSLSCQPRSEMVDFTPKSSRIGKGPSPASVIRSDQDVSVHREAQRGGKGIKKIQVTVTFDGAEDLVVDATLRKRDQREHREGQ